MDDNSLLVIILAFMLGCMCSGMMKQMCGGRLVEGSFWGPDPKIKTIKGDKCTNDPYDSCGFWYNCYNGTCH